MNRRKFLQISGALCAGSFFNTGFAIGKEALTEQLMDKYSFPVMDLHVHRSKDLTVDAIVAKSRQLNMKIGVMENIAPWGITNDAQLKEYIDAIKPYPVYIGLQPMSPGWSENLSSELIAQADYIAMDPQIVTNGNGYGETVMLWKYNAYIDDLEEFMERNMRYYMEILTSEEPLDIFACPLFLPCCIQRKYDALWTKKRLRQIIDAASAKKVAIEINDTAHVPHEEFILMAKKAGLKFVFGSDTRNHTLGRLDYCRRVAKRCNLSEKDFFMPERHFQ